MHLQNQPSRGFLRKKCSKNVQQICRRTLMPKCDVNKVALRLYGNHTSALVVSCKFSAGFAANAARLLRCLTILRHCENIGLI